MYWSTLLWSETVVRAARRRWRDCARLTSLQNVLFESCVHRLFLTCSSTISHEVDAAANTSSRAWVRQDSHTRESRSSLQVLSSDCICFVSLHVVAHQQVCVLALTTGTQHIERTSLSVVDRSHASKRRVCAPHVPCNSHTIDRHTQTSSSISRLDVFHRPKPVCRTAWCINRSNKSFK